MRIYYGGCDRPNAIRTLIKSGVRRALVSFASPPSEQCWKLLREHGFTVMADSGAFSAWKAGLEIDINEYAQWLQEAKPNIYFNLDVVGEPVATANNQAWLEKKGLSPIPVFHYGEGFGILAKMVLKYPLVGLGGTVGLRRSLKYTWFSAIFSAFPEGRFHALGLTEREMLASFPFITADSTWWLYRYRDKQARLSDGDNQQERLARIRWLETVCLRFEQPVLQGAMFI
jgi:hypothetical protein